MESIRAGIARKTISTLKGTYLSGYGKRFRGAKSVRDELTLTSLVLSDGSSQIAILSIDIMIISNATADRIRREISKNTGIQYQGILLNGSHSHSTPLGHAIRISSRKQKRFIETLVQQSVAATVESLESMEEAAIESGIGESSIAVNRRVQAESGEIVFGVNPDGAVDTSLNVLCIKGQKGQIMGSLVNYACHATVLGYKHRMVSADWPGEMRKVVEKEIGGLCLFLQGAAGNLNPNHEWGDDDSEAVSYLGSQVGQDVVSVIKNGLETLSFVPFKFESAKINLPLEIIYDKKNGKPIDYKRALSKYTYIPRILVELCRFFVFPLNLQHVSSTDGTPVVPIELQVIRLGDYAIVAHAGEVFTEIGMSIKEKSPVKRTLFLGYSNGMITYVPTKDAHNLGGYEVLAPYFYKLPGIYAAECEEKLVDSSLEMLHRANER